MSFFQLLPKIHSKADSSEEAGISTWNRQVAKRFADQRNASQQMIKKVPEVCIKKEIVINRLCCLVWQLQQLTIL
jgi:hypothetical protein